MWAASALLRQSRGVAGAVAAAALGGGSLSWANAPQEGKAPGSEAGLPVYRLTEVKKRDGRDGTTWITYKDGIYDITDFINGCERDSNKASSEKVLSHSHPGGASKIVLAAGGSVEPFWHVYRQHFATTQAFEMLAEMEAARRIGTVHAEDYAKAVQATPVLDDAYADEPSRHPALIVHGATPMNAEPPGALLEEFLTPNAVWFVRHHHPVPKAVDDRTYRLAVTVDAKDFSNAKALTLEDLRGGKFKALEVVTTMQCSGNRRAHMNTEGPTSGTPWRGGAISTAKWKGAPLREIIAEMLGCSLGDVLSNAQLCGASHVVFHGADGMSASVPIEKAASELGEALVAYEMNGVPVPRDHGGPVRAIMPGYAGVRNVKWVDRITLQAEEAEGAWQRGMNYKAMPSHWRTTADIKDVDFSKLPTIYELPTNCVVTTPSPGARVDDDELEVRGFALGGAGRSIVRVELSVDGGATWHEAELGEGADQHFGRAWAWTQWTAVLPAPRSDFEVIARAMDSAGNSMPETPRDIWNLRGLNNNAWFRVPLKRVGSS